MNLKDILKGDHAAITIQTLRDYTYEISRVANFTGIENRIVVTSSLGAIGD